MISKQKALVFKNPLFRSYYCLGCKQKKPCGVLEPNQNYCCSCFYHGEVENSHQYSNYQQVCQRKLQDRQTRIQQLKLLQEYAGCKDCGSKEVDAYELYENNQLVCRSCLVKKIGGSSSPISFANQSQWYKKQWGINLGEWLENFSQLPVNANCAKKWLKNKQHLNNCACLELEAKEIYQLFTSSLREMEEKLAKCQCETSQKVRVDSDYSTWCEKCEKSISVASKKRVIKNRNDPRFWGLEVKEKVLCGTCLEVRKEDMTPLKRAKFNEYKKLGRL